MLILYLFTSPIIIITFALELTFTLALTPHIYILQNLYRKVYWVFYMLEMPYFYPWLSWHVTRQICLHYHNLSQDPSIHRMDIRLHFTIPCKPLNNELDIMCRNNKQNVFLSSLILVPLRPISWKQKGQSAVSAASWWVLDRCWYFISVAL